LPDFLPYDNAMKTISIANQKGGVGKTTTTAALGSILSDMGFRVLLIDMDSQASLTKAFGVNGSDQSIADVLGSAQKGNLAVQDVIKPIRDRLSIAPSNILMYTTEMGLVGRMGRETILKKALDELTGFDVVLIDCPPSMGMLTINGLVASQGIIIPSLPSETDIQGVGSILETLGGIEAAGLNGRIELLGILVVMFDGRTTAHNRIMESIQAKHSVLGIIPRSVRVQEAVAAKQSVTEFAPYSKPALAYVEVGEKIKSWLDNAG